MMDDASAADSVRMSDVGKATDGRNTTGTMKEQMGKWEGTVMAEERECCRRTGSHKSKERPEAEYKDLIHRLNRIEGQIRGIRGMVEKDVYCTDILVQVAAVTAALNSFNKVLLANHIKTCVTRDILEGKEDTVDELVATLQKLMR